MSLVLEGVSRSFGGEHGQPSVPALGQTDLQIRQGEFVCILGRSGCGKSTLLRLLAGLDRPDGGRVLHDGREVTAPGPARMLMFQEAALFPWLDVCGNVQFPLAAQGMPTAESRRVALQWLGLVGLEQFATFRVHQLSGGMRQRVALARALAPKPGVLLMDEPFAALDAMTRDSLYADLQALWGRSGATIVMVTHNVREAVCLGSRIVLMAGKPGRMVDDIAINLPRPRVMNDVELVRLAAHIDSRLATSDGGRP